MDCSALKASDVISPPEYGTRMERARTIDDEREKQEMKSRGTENAKRNDGGQETCPLGA